MGKTRDLFKKIGDTKCIGDSVHDTSSLALHTAHTMPEPRAGKAQTKRLEDSGAMWTADMFILSCWHSSRSSKHTISSPLVTDSMDTAVVHQ